MIRCTSNSNRLDPHSLTDGSYITPQPFFYMRSNQVFSIFCAKNKMYLDFWICFFHDLSVLLWLIFVRGNIFKFLTDFYSGNRKNRNEKWVVRCESPPKSGLDEIFRLNDPTVSGGATLGRPASERDLLPFHTDCSLSWFLSVHDSHLSIYKKEFSSRWTTEMSPVHKIGYYSTASQNHLMTVNNCQSSQ